MIRSLRGLALVASLLLLTACGFHLRGLSGPLKPMPFASLAIVGQGPVYDEALRIVRRDQPALLKAKSADAEVVLTVSGDSTSKDILTTNAAGKANTYQLTLTVQASASSKNSDVPTPLTVVVRREMTYSDSAFLGKQYEEDLIWSDMRREAGETLARRLAYLKFAPPAVKDASGAASQR